MKDLGVVFRIEMTIKFYSYILDCNRSKGPQGNAIDLANELNTVLGDQDLMTFSQVVLSDNRVLTTMAYYEEEQKEHECLHWGNMNIKKLSEKEQEEGAHNVKEFLKK